MRGMAETCLHVCERISPLEYLAHDNKAEHHPKQRQREWMDWRVQPCFYVAKVLP